MNYIEELREVIRNIHGAEATHVESVPVTEKFRGQTVWDGVVEVFELQGHPIANRVYAWAHETGDMAKPVRHVTVLHVAPITSAIAAVRAAITQEYLNRGTEEA